VTITTVGLDGDDTLWHSESHFELTTARLVDLLEPWVDSAADPRSVHDRLIATERRNLALLGYGVKAFTLSMVETAIEVSDGSIPATAIREIIGWGRELLDHPVELLDGVEDTLRLLGDDYRLVLITKGDLLHQESKIALSGLEPLFSGIEIISEKDPATYRRVLARQAVEPARFTMVGNSVRSDVIPVLELGGTAVHVPYHVTWALEHHEGGDATAPFPTITSITELPEVLAILEAGRD
jgi:putative hydrolase of the HAD superfamily